MPITRISGETKITHVADHCDYGIVTGSDNAPEAIFVTVHFTVCGEPQTVTAILDADETQEMIVALQATREVLRRALKRARKGKPS